MDGLCYSFPTSQPSKLPEHVEVSPFTVYSHCDYKGPSDIKFIFDPTTSIDSLLTNKPGFGNFETTIGLPSGESSRPGRTYIYTPRKNDGDRALISDIQKYDHGLSEHYPWESRKAQKIRTGLANGLSKHRERFKQYSAKVHGHTEDQIPHNNLNFVMGDDSEVAMDIGEVTWGEMIRRKIFSVLYPIMGKDYTSSFCNIVLILVIILIVLISR